MISSVMPSLLQTIPMNSKPHKCYQSQLENHSTTKFTPVCTGFRNNVLTKHVKPVVCTRKQITPYATAQTSSDCENVQDDIVRPLAHFSPDIWKDSFMSFSLEDNFRLEKYELEVEPLKEEVRKLLMDDAVKLSKKMTLIDEVERLGVYYYYHNEIQDLLSKIYGELAQNNFQNLDLDLFDTATHFRVLRRHGFKVPCDIFNKFTDGNGKFNENLKNDTRGLLSLYEAAHLRIHGDDILDEAISFTTEILESVSKISKQVKHALKQALHFGNQRDECAKFISFYEEDIEHQNETLLCFAKIEYNRLQLIHRQELSQIQRWWHAFDLGNKLPYARGRSVECLYCVTMIYFEPQYSFARILLTKLFLVLSLLDDTYDAYGTLQELKLLTEAFERWDMNTMEQLPEDYMKVVYNFVLKTFDEFAMEMDKRGKLFAATYTKDRVVDLVRCYLNEAKWLKAGYMPTFEEYMDNAGITSAVQLIITASLMGMDEIKDEKPFQHIMQSSKAIAACEVLGRLSDDLAGHEEEQARGDFASSVECYMHNYNKSKEETLPILKKMIEKSWKEMNEELLCDVSTNIHNLFSRAVLIRILNLCRMSDVLYKGKDGYTHAPEMLKEVVCATYINPFSV